MTDTTKPRELTVAEVDAIAEAGSGWCGEETFASLCRMARAMAVAGDGNAMLEWVDEDDWICHMYGAHDGSLGVGASAIEAIEAADAARRTG